MCAEKLEVEVLGFFLTFPKQENAEMANDAAVSFRPRKPFINAMLDAGPLGILAHEPASLLAENHREGYKMTCTFGD